MHTNDNGVTELLLRASDGPTPDVNRLVAGGITRGRSRQRRARIGTAVASLAVIGVIGTLAAVVPQSGPDRTAGGIATDSGGSTPPPETTSEAPVIFNMPATEFPATVGQILGLTDVTPALQDPRYPDMVQDTEDIKSASFRVDGMLVRVMVFGGEVAKDALRGVGDGETRGGEYTKDGVTMRSAGIRRGGYVISVAAHNAADASDSPALAAEPVLSASQLMDVVTSDVWFESGQTDTPATSATSEPTPAVSEPPRCEELDAPPVSEPTPVSAVPDQDAEHIAYNDSGTVAAWFNQAGALPELIVFDLGNQEELAREDAGPGYVRKEPSLRIVGQVLYFRSGADRNVWLRYEWQKDDFPLVYLTCT